ncbi:hypothetical protein P43SY_004600 [Pythium insidiosum]|uniref:RRM domain-containing protein n=1 Tax=Pythium insidiosum TaxID=114742 RepID=A0AAD5QBF8_PYTIN|nr:hypothetical protein P43SY_004600 [Pythium insidiosum]
MAAELWRSEAQRASAFLAQRRREREALDACVFQRIRAHLGSREHEHARPAAAASDDDDGDSDNDDVDDTVELALDFLNGVDEQDMKTLLNDVPASGPATQMPLQMPLHLQSALNPSLPMALAPVTAVPPPPAVDADADAGVAALMDELQLDVAAFATETPSPLRKRTRPEHEERKTEESTPPAHVQRGEADAQPPSKTLVAGLVDEDAVAAEMLSWVSGMRDPDVVKRKETLRAHRRQVTRLGVTSYADSSDDSLSANDSDFSPMDEPEEEAEEPLNDAEELLPDDYLDDRLAPPPKRRRRRLKQRADRQTKPKTKPKTKTPPKHEHRQERTTQSPVAATATAARRLVVNESSSSDEEEAPQRQRKPDAMAANTTAIDLRSDDDDDEENGAARMEQAQSTADSMVLRFKMSPSLRASLTRPNDDDAKPTGTIEAKGEPRPTAPLKAATTEQDDEEDGGYNTDDLSVEPEPELHEADDDAANGGMETGGDGGEVSDTGTLDLSDDDADAEMTTVSSGGECTPPSRSSPTGASTLQPVAPDAKLSLSPTKATPSAAADEVVSEAETVNFEDVSEIDFGSSESEADYGGDVVILGDGTKTTSAREDDDDDDGEEEEFGQFFSQKTSKPKAPKKQSVVSPPKAAVSSKAQEEKGADEKPPQTTVAKKAKSPGTTPTKNETPGGGSNGLRRVRNLNTTTIPKGRYQHTRRAIRMLDEHGRELPSTEIDPKQAQLQRSRLRPSDVMSAPEGTTADASGRYLGYARPMPDDDKREMGRRPRAPPPPTPKELFQESAKLVRERLERQNKTRGLSTPVEAAKTLSRPVFRTTDDEDDVPLSKSLSKTGVYIPPRQPQMDVYQATGARSQVDLHSTHLQLQHKRPVALLKQIEEAKRQGKELVRPGLPVDLDERAPIPKKAKPPPPSAAAIANAKRLAERQQGEETGKSHRKSDKSRWAKDKDPESSLDANRRRVESGEPPQKKAKNAPSKTGSKQSYYGPHTAPYKSSTPERKYRKEDRESRDSRGRDSSSSYHSSRPNARPVPRVPPQRSPEEEGFISDSDDGFVELDGDDGGSKARTQTDEIRVCLDDVAVDWDLLKRTVYVTNLTAMMDEPQLAELFAPFGLARNPETGYPAVDVFLCQRNLRNRGDARVTLKHRDAAESAVRELNALIVKTSRINVRLMDVNTMRILTLQHDTYRDTWTCSKPQCRAKISIWTTRCSACYRHRVFPLAGSIVGNDNDWLCSICFTSNNFFAPKCRSCHSMLPDPPESRR